MEYSKETALLGGIILEPSRFKEAATLAAEDFSLDSHRRIFAHIKSLAENEMPIDFVTLCDALGSDIEKVGGHAYVSSLIDGVPDRSNIAHYASMVRQDAAQRRCRKRFDVLAKTNPSIAEIRANLQQIENDLAQCDSSDGRISDPRQVPDPLTIDAEAIKWCVDGVIPAGGITILAGEGGAGKTWLALALSRSVIFGNDFLGRKTEKADVIYLDRENPLNVVRDRLQIMFRGPGLLRPWGMWCQDQPPLIGDPRLLDFAKNKPLIILDSLIRFHSADENSATEMAPVMAHIRAMTTVGATVLILHHRSKSETSTYRGSSDILNGADALLALSKRGELLELKHGKNRAGAELSFTIRPEFAAGRFDSVDSPAAAQRRDDIAELRQAIEANPGMNLRQIVAAVGMWRNTVSDLLRSHDGKHWRSELGPRNSRLYFPVRVQ